MTDPTRLPKARNDLASHLIAEMGRIEPFVSATIRPQEFWACAIAEVNGLRNPGRINKDSVLVQVANCAQTGLRLGKTFGHAYLVPFNDNESGTKNLQLIFGYKGLLELAYRNNFLAGVEVELVLTGEECRVWNDETGKKLRHDRDELRRPIPTPDNIIGAYCTYTTRAGFNGVHVMPEWEVQRAIAKNSRKKDSLWKNEDTLPDMVRKSPLRRASKLWQLTSEMAAAVALDEQWDRDEDQRLDGVDLSGGMLPRPENPAKSMLAATLDGKCLCTTDEERTQVCRYALNGCSDWDAIDNEAATQILTNLNTFTTRAEYRMKWSQIRERATEAALAQ